MLAELQQKCTSGAIMLKRNKNKGCIAHSKKCAHPLQNRSKNKGCAITHPKTKHERSLVANCSLIQNQN
jgi:hypothetical protein